MRWLVGLFVLLLSMPASAFEGEIDAKSIGEPSEGVTMEILVSNRGDVRMDTAAKGPGGELLRSSYIVPAKGKYNYALDHARKQATKIKKETVAKLSSRQGGPDKGKRGNIEVKKLGKEAIAGVPTRHIRVIDKSDGSTADLWLSDRYPAKLWLTVFSVGGRDGNSQSGQWATIMRREYGVEPGFIMKALSTDGGKKAGLEVTRIQAKKVPPKAFTVPAGYSVAQAPDFAGAPTDMNMPTTPEEAEKMREEWMKRMQQQQR